MTDYISGKSIIITGAGSGFGRLVSEKAAAKGAKVTCADINKDAVKETVKAITAAGGTAQAVTADVTDANAMNALAQATIDAYGKIDVMLNNAGVMPLGFFSDHKTGLDKWHQCIDINIKGVLNGMVAVYDQMISQQEGQIINVSSIYGNYPVTGAAVYGATKAAVNFLSESMRVESRGKIKVTTVKPTGVPGTNLASGVVNPAAVVGIVGHNAPDYIGLLGALGEGKVDAPLLDETNVQYAVLDPAHIADQVLHAINQPMGVSIGDITVRAAGDHYVI